MKCYIYYSLYNNYSKLKREILENLDWGNALNLFSFVDWFDNI